MGAVCNGWVLVATAGKVIRLFAVGGAASGAPHWRPLAEAVLAHEVACMALKCDDAVAPLAFSDSMDTATDGGTAAEPTLAAVGLWTELSVLLLDLPSLNVRYTERLGVDVIPRSLLFFSADDKEYLLCALGDGQLMSFTLSGGPAAGGAAANGSAAEDAAPLALGDRNNVMLGTQPISLVAIPSGGAWHVFAASDRPTVIHSTGSTANPKLLFSNVNLRDASHMTAFRSQAKAPMQNQRSPATPTPCLSLPCARPRHLVSQPLLAALCSNMMPPSPNRRRTPALIPSPPLPFLQAMPDCLAIAAEDCLIIGTIDGVQKLHVRTERLGEQPRRLAHVESVRAFGLLCLAVEYSATGESTERSFVRLLDDQTFERLACFELQPQETGCSILYTHFADGAAASTATASSASAGVGAGTANCSSSACAAEFGSGAGKGFLVVGTAFVREAEEESHEGRLLIFELVERSFELVHERTVTGAVYCLSALGGRMLAGVNNKLQLYSWAPLALGCPNGLALLDEHCGHILVLYVHTRGDFVLVGCLMKSVTLLRHEPESAKLHELARDFNANWMTAVSFLDDDCFLGADNCFNLFVSRKNSEATTDEERARLGIVGEYNLGEFVNRFRRGSLTMQVGGLCPRALRAARNVEPPPTPTPTLRAHATPLAERRLMTQVHLARSAARAFSCTDNSATQRFPSPPALYATLDLLPSRLGPDSPRRCLRRAHRHCPPSSMAR